jgi:hypothetical protein
MFENFLWPQLEEMDVADAWFQQDGATAHTVWRSMQVLREMFPRKLISLCGDVGWLVHSPDLSLPAISSCGATTLEISFLKHDDKNYSIYPFLCYNEIFCIYHFYRINV